MATNPSLSIGKHLFHARLERIATSAEYYAFTVPLATSRALGTRGPVPVSVRLNGSAPYFVSLAPIGGGRHWLRVNAQARAAAAIKGGDLVQVEITVLDHAAGITIPADLAKALRTAGVLAGFRVMSLGRQNMLIKGIGQAVQPLTRARRIQLAVEEGRRRKGRR